jgi:tRNA nucleotidyltransferase (CCA-adding enzyme)
MAEITNLTGEIESQLPAELASFMQTAGNMAAKREQGLYLVGGMVRDLLLKRSNFDLDLVLEGDAITLAKQLNRTLKGEITVHRQFGTANLQWEGWSIDLATARSET